MFISFVYRDFALNKPDLNIFFTKEARSEKSAENCCRKRWFHEILQGEKGFADTRSNIPDLFTNNLAQSAFFTSNFRVCTISITMQKDRFSKNPNQRHKKTGYSAGLTKNPG
ncbi:MAG: hypothetical protein INR69_09845 [Mucilaginibacter polytrichastri]|nr:hypothetical protein [Mucilaginibacter polytrichastri]